MSSKICKDCLNAAKGAVPKETILQIADTLQISFDRFCSRKRFDLEFEMIRGLRIAESFAGESVFAEIGEIISLTEDGELGRLLSATNNFDTNLKGPGLSRFSLVRKFRNQEKLREKFAKNLLDIKEVIGGIEDFLNSTAIFRENNQKAIDRAG